MLTRSFDFSCSDAILTQEWESSVFLFDRDTLSSLIVRHLDAAPSADTPEIDIESITSPLHTILGISAEEPGFTCVRVAPHPSGLDWAKGYVTIPEGLVTVAWTRAEDEFLLDVSIPVGVHLKAVLSAHRGDGLFVNGEPIDPDSQTIWTTHHVELAVLPGSDYRFEVISKPTD